MAVEYDRELIACMLEMSAGHIETFNEASMQEQARLLREADNADASGVHTATQPPAVGVDVSDEMVERVEQTVGMGCTAWDMVDPKELIRAAAAALRTGGGEADDDDDERPEPCESGLPRCGPAVAWDVEGIGLCAACAAEFCAEQERS